MNNVLMHVGASLFGVTLGMMKYGLLWEFSKLFVMYKCILHLFRLTRRLSHGDLEQECTCTISVCHIEI